MRIPRRSARRVNFMKTKTIKVDTLARVEGEGALYVKIKGDKVMDVKLRIYEPPRFFEALLRGRMYAEAPDITARICGICPVAYQMSTVHAMEQALGVTVGGQLRELRRLLYCGEWIESRIVSNKGLDIPVQAYEEHFAEEHVAHSNALHSVLKERGAYFVEPLARYNLNFERLSSLAQETARAAGLGPVCRNPFQSII